MPSAPLLLQGERPGGDAINPAVVMEQVSSLTLEGTSRGTGAISARYGISDPFAMSASVAPSMARVALAVRPLSDFTLGAQVFGPQTLGVGLGATLESIPLLQSLSVFGSAFESRTYQLGLQARFLDWSLIVMEDRKQTRLTGVTIARLFDAGLGVGLIVSPAAWWDWERSVWIAPLDFSIEARASLAVTLRIGFGADVLDSKNRKGVVGAAFNTEHWIAAVSLEQGKELAASASLSLL